MKRLVMLSGLALLGFIAWETFAVFTPLQTGETFVDLPRGTGVRAMGQRLQKNGIIRSGTAFLLLRLVKGGRLQAGEYRFSGAANAFNVYTRIQRGDVYTRTLLIPEGFNLFDIAHAIEASGLASSEAFLEAARTNVDLIAMWAPGAPSLEGFLYPETYRFSRHTPVRSMQQVMVKRFSDAAAKLSLSSNIYQTVILASLVEKEVRYDEERSLAAGVFSNRLARGMPLQTDPSVVYAAQLSGRWTGTIRRSDLQFDSPYNTYLHSGLPPGPICSPGRAALTAAVTPAQTAQMYFVAGANGHTLFSTTLEEHSKRVAAYRQSLGSAARRQ